MKKGQQESAFQWIYVLIAGAAFLFFFFMIFKSCSSSGEKVISAEGFDSGISSLSGAAWERESATTIFFPPANIICPAGTNTLTIQSGNNRKSIDRLPVFLSPTIGGRTTIITKDIFSPEGIEPLLLGSLAYGVDSQAEYYLIDDAGARSNSMYAQSIISTVASTNIAENFKLIRNSGVAAAVNKQKSGTAVVVLFKAGPLQASNLPSGLSDGTIFLYVNTTSSTINFFERKNNAWNSAGSSYYANDAARYFLLGAIISAKQQNYECSKSAITDRMEKVTNVYMMRSDVLRNSASPLISADCKALHDGAFSYLNDTNYYLSQGEKDSKDSYLQRLLVSRNLTNYQEAIKFTTDCPEIS